MTSSFITKDGEHGFWIGDSLMKIACWGLVSAIDTDNSVKPAWLDEFGEHLFNNPQGFFVGFMHLSLEKFLVGEERKIRFLNIIQGANFFFRGYGETVPAEEINAFQLDKEVRHIWSSPFETSRVIKILEYLEDMMNDKLTIMAGNEIDYAF